MCLLNIVSGVSNVSIGKLFHTAGPATAYACFSTCSRVHETSKSLLRSALRLRTRHMKLKQACHCDCLVPVNEVPSYHACSWCSQ